MAVANFMKKYKFEELKYIFYFKLSGGNVLLCGYISLLLLNILGDRGNINIVVINFIISQLTTVLQVTVNNYFKVRTTCTHAVKIEYKITIYFRFPIHVKKHARIQ